MDQLPEDTRRFLHATALERQREGRVPGVLAAVVRGGELVWWEGIGTAEVGTDRAPGPDDQFLVASNTKTFTAVMVMQLRDEGRLTLDDRIGDHVPGVSHPTTIRQGLAHVSGLQREPVGDVWDSLVQPDEDDLVENFAAVERVGRPHDRWHYSNIVYAVLGRLVATLDGRSWNESLRARLLDPLGLTRTTIGFDGGPQAHGYFVPPYHDVPRREPLVDTRAMAPCGGLASTARDLARWSAFVADPDPAVLSPDTLEEMTQPQVLMDPERWNVGMGLGFFVVRAGDRSWVGHDGGMPGHITGVHTHRESGTGGIVLMNASDSPDPTAFAIALAGRVVDDVPVEDQPWRPGTEVPEELTGILGRWYTEGRPFTMSVREGRLEASADGLPGRKPSVFVAEGPGLYRTVSGRERGELLRLTRDDDGRVREMHWATYLVTREPLGFGEHLE
ncbi:MAG: serine hydrolase domain-containing protein [Nocardioides sp.]